MTSFAYPRESDESESKQVGYDGMNKRTVLTPDNPYVLCSCHKGVGKKQQLVRPTTQYVLRC